MDSLPSSLADEAHSIAESDGVGGQGDYMGELPLKLTELRLDMTELFPIFLDYPREEIHKISPSCYINEMQLTTEERMNKLVHPLRRHFATIRDEPERPPKNYKPTPSVVMFQNWQLGNTYTVVLSIRNTVEVLKSLRMHCESSRVFAVSYTSSLVHVKVAPGMTVMFTITFKPRDKQDYKHSVTFETDDEHFVVPIIAIGPRPLLDFPDRVDIPTSIVKITASKMLYVRNIGEVPAVFSLITQSPFSVEPKRGVVAAKGAMQVLVSFDSMKVGTYDGELKITYETGEILYMTLHACAENAMIKFDKTNVRFENTFMGLKRERRITLHNGSDHIVTFKWEKFLTYEEEVMEGEKLKDTEMEYHDVINNEDDKLVNDRIQADEIKALKHENFPFFNENFTITPESGEVWPQGKMDMLLVFEPAEKEEYACEAYCDVSGREKRLIVKMQGEGIGPSITLNLVTLDIDYIFLCSEHYYEVVVTNKGDIPGRVDFKPGECEFGGRTSCSPLHQWVLPGKHETFVISFSSNRQGEFVETIEFIVHESKENISFLLKGKIVSPTLHFNTTHINYKDIPVGFPCIHSLFLNNLSMVPVNFNLRVMYDGVVPSYTYKSYAALAVKTALPAHPKEFTIEPSAGVVPAYSSQTITLRLTPNICRIWSTALVVDMWDSKSESVSLPLSYCAKIPQVTCKPREIVIRFCFLNFPYTRNIVLENRSHLPGFFYIAPQNVSDSSDMTFTTPLTQGIIKPKSSVNVPLTIMTKGLGKHVSYVNLMMLGEKQSQQICQLACTGQGPVISVEEHSLAWGETQLLQASVMSVKITNDSPIPATFKPAIKSLLVDFTSRDSSSPDDPKANSPWSVSLDWSVLNAEETTTIDVTVYLTDTGTYNENMEIRVQNSRAIIIELSATGIGSSIVLEPQICPKYYMGSLFRHQPIVRQILVTNKGRRTHQVMWSIPYDKKRRSIDQTPETMPVFRVRPDKITLKQDQSAYISIYGQSEDLKSICETLLIHAIIENKGKKLLLMTSVLMATFIDPMITFTKKSILFRFDVMPNVVFQLQKERIGLTNLAEDLPLTVELSIAYPFMLGIDSDGEPIYERSILLPGQSGINVDVYFDPSTESGSYSTVTNDVLKIQYKEHPQKNTIPVRGEVNFPNLQLESKSIDFKCVPVGSQACKQIVVTNPSPLYVNFWWYWIKQSINIRQTCPRESTLVIESETNLLSDSRLPVIVDDESENNSLSTPGASATNQQEELISVTMPADYAVDEMMLPDITTISPTVPVVADVKTPAYTVEVNELREKIWPIMCKWFQPEQSMPLFESLPERRRSCRPINQLFNITPFYGRLSPFESQIITVTYDGRYHVSADATAMCVVEGGPTEKVQISASASNLSVRLDRRHIDYGRRLFCVIAEEKLHIKNVGHLGVDFLSDTIEPPENLKNILLEWGFLTVLPKRGHVVGGSVSELAIKYFPGVPGKFVKQFELEIGHLYPLTITIEGNAVIPQLYVCLPRPPSYEVPVATAYAAVAGLTADFLPRRKRKRHNNNVYTGQNLYDKPIKQKELDNLFMNGWCVVYYADLYPTVAEIELAIERVQACDHITSHPSINVKPGAVTTVKNKNIPDFSVAPYIINFGLVIVSMMASFSAILENLGPVPAVTNLLLPQLKNPLDTGVTVHFRDNLEISPNDTSVFHVSLLPNVDKYPLKRQELNYVFHLAIVNGAMIPIHVHAVIVIPFVTISVKSLTFGQVLCSQCHMTKIRVRNEGWVPCSWEAKLISRSVSPSIGGTRNKEYPTLPSTSAYRLIDSCGTLQPKKSSYLEIQFQPMSPGMHEIYVEIIMTHNPHSLRFKLHGEGLEPCLVVSQNNIVFDPCLPFPPCYDQQITINNPCDFPVEMFFPAVDSLIATEERVLRVLSHYYNLAELYLPVRKPGEPLPIQFYEFYQAMVDKANTKLILQQMELRKTEEPAESIRHESTDIVAVVESKESHEPKERRKSTKRRSKTKLLSATSKSSFKIHQSPPHAITLEKIPDSDAPELESVEYDSLLNKSPTVIEAAVHDYINDLQSIEDFSCSNDDPIKKAFQSTVIPPEPPDPTISKSGVLIVFHGAPLTGYKFAAARAARTVGLTLLTIDQIILECAALGSSETSVKVKEYIDTAFKTYQILTNVKVETGDEAGAEQEELDGEDNLDILTDQVDALYAYNQILKIQPTGKKKGGKNKGRESAKSAKSKGDKKGTSKDGTTNDISKGKSEKGSPKDKKEKGSPKDKAGKGSTRTSKSSTTKLGKSTSKSAKKDATLKVIVERREPTGILADLPVSLVLEALSERLQSYECSSGVIIESLVSKFFDNVPKALNSLLKAVGNIKHIQLVTFVNSFQQHLDFLIKQKAEDEAREAHKQLAKIAYLESLSNEDMLCDEDKLLFRELKLKSRWETAMKKGEEAKSKTQQQTAGKSKKGLQLKDAPKTVDISPTMKRKESKQNKSKPSESQKTISVDKKKEPKKEESKKESKKGKSKGSSKSSKKSIVPKYIIPPGLFPEEPTELIAQFDIYEAEIEELMPMLEYWDRSLGETVGAPPPRSSSGKSKKGDKEKKVSKKSVSAGKGRVGSSKPTTPLPLPTSEPLPPKVHTPEELKLIALRGVSVWLVDSRNPDTPKTETVASVMKDSEEIKAAQPTDEEEEEPTSVETFAFDCVIPTPEREQVPFDDFFSLSFVEIVPPEVPLQPEAPENPEKSELELGLQPDTLERVVEPGPEQEIDPEKGPALAHVVESEAHSAPAKKGSIVLTDSKKTSDINMKTKDSSQLSIRSSKSRGMNKRRDSKKNKRLSQSSSKLSVTTEVECEVEASNKFKTRWVLKPGEKQIWKIRFYPLTVGTFTQSYTIELLGWTNTYTFTADGLCDVPRIDMNTYEMFSQVIESKSTVSHVYTPTYFKNKNSFDFGALLMARSADAIDGRAGSIFKLTNCSILPIELTISYLDEAFEEVLHFTLDSQMMHIEPGASQTLVVHAFPRVLGKCSETVVLSIKDNPHLEFIKLVCYGIKCDFELDTNIINFDHLLLYRSATRTLTLFNKCLIPLLWSFVDFDELLDEVDISEKSGLIKAKYSKAVNFTYYSKTVQVMDKIPLKIEVHEVHAPEADPVYSDTIYISVESIDVMIDIKFINPPDDYVNFGEVKVGHEYSQLFEIFNRGKYDLRFMLQTEENLQGLSIPNREEVIKISPVTDKLPVGNVPAVITMNFKPVIDLDIKHVLFKCHFFDIHNPSMVITTLPIRVVTKSFYSAFKVVPTPDINFGPLSLGAKQEIKLMIENTGKFDFVYTITRVPKPTDDIISADTTKGGKKKDDKKGKKEKKGKTDKKGKGSASAKTAKSKGSPPEKKSKSAKKDASSDKKSKSQVSSRKSSAAGKKSKASKKSASGKKSAGSKGSKGMPKKPVIVAIPLQAGPFHIKDTAALVEPGETVVISVHCTVRAEGPFDEEILIHVTEEAPPQSGCPVKLMALGALPFIDFNDLESIFQEQYVCDNLHEFSVPDELGTHGVYVKESKKLQLNRVCVGTKYTTRLWLRNQGLVSGDVTVHLTVPPRLTKASSDGIATHQAFTVTPLAITIAPFMTECVTIVFNPMLLEVFSASLTINMDMPIVHRANRMTVQLEGEGVTPQIIITSPSVRDNEGRTLVMFRPTVVGQSSTKQLVFKNSGIIFCRVIVEFYNNTEGLFSMYATQDTMSLMKTLETTEPIQHTTIVNLSIGQTAGFAIKFTPKDDKHHDAEIRLYIIDNPFENEVIILKAEGYVDDVTLDGIYKDAIEDKMLIRNEDDDDLEPPVYHIDLGKLYVKESKKRCFKITNNSIDDAYRFQWQNNPFVTVCPSVGHINPRMCKDTLVIFKALEPIKLEKMGLQCDIVKITYPTDNSKAYPTGWDNRARSDAILPAYLHEEVDGSRPNSIRSSLGGNDSTKVSSEPAFDVVIGTAQEITLKISAECNYTSYTCSIDAIKFGDTLMFQTLVRNFSLKNTSPIPLEYHWHIIMDARVSITSLKAGSDESSFSQTTKKALDSLLSLKSYDQTIAMQVSQSSQPQSQSSLQVLNEDSNLTLVPVESDYSQLIMRERVDSCESIPRRVGSAHTLADHQTQLHYSRRPMTSQTVTGEAGDYFGSRKIARPLTGHRGFLAELAGQPGKPEKTPSPLTCKRPLPNIDFNPFHIDIVKGKIEPGMETQFSMTFAPLDVAIYNANLICKIPNLLPEQGQLQLTVQARSSMPYAHFDVGESDYVTSGRRDASLPGPNGQPGGVTLDPNTRVIEFNVLGVGVAFSKKFKLINPTDKDYSYLWINADPKCANKVSPFHCATIEGWMQHGRHVDIEFSFTAEKSGIFESFWTFSIPEQRLEIPFLFVGTASYPLVQFSCPHLKLTSTIIGFKTEKMFGLVNKENVPFEFSFVTDSLFSEGRQQHVDVEPLSGVIPPNKETAINVSYTPSASGDIMFHLKCFVKKAEKHLEINVETLCYVVQPVASYSNAEKKRFQLSHTQANIVDLGELTPRCSETLTFQVTNIGRISFFYNWKYNEEDARDRKLKLTISEDCGQITSQSKSTNTMTITLLTKINLVNYPIYLQISKGPTYKLLLNGASGRPLFNFSFSKYNFGHCFIQNTELWTYSVDLEFENVDDTALIFECFFVNKPHLKVEMSNEPVPPKTSVVITISFKPLARCKYSETLIFLVNGLHEKKITVTGEGVDIKLVLVQPSLKNVNLGAPRVGQSISKVLPVINKSHAPVTVQFGMCDEEDPGSNSVTLSDEKNKPEKVFRVIPKRPVTIKPLETVNVTVKFTPAMRMKPFTTRLCMHLYGCNEPVSILKGCCIDAEFSLNRDCLPFGAVVEDCTSELKVSLINSGDIGAKFHWPIEKWDSSNFSITPSHGYCSPGMEVTFNVKFHPTKLSLALRNEVECQIESYKTLSLILSGSCVSRPPPKEVIHFSTPVRQHNTKSIPINNRSGVSWQILPLLTGDYFTGADFITVLPRTIVQYAITYSPLRMSKVDGKHKGSVFFRLPEGTGLMYDLLGNADPPPMIARITRQVPCKTAFTEPIPVSNWLHTTHRFLVKTEYIKTDKVEHFHEISGNHFIDVPGNSERMYRFNFYGYKEADMLFKVTFTSDETCEYQYYELMLSVIKCGPLELIKMVTCVRNPVKYELKLVNPMNNNVTFNLICSSHDLSFPAQRVVPAKSSEFVVLEYCPLYPGESTHRLEVTSPDLGSYPHEINLKADPAVTPKPIIFNTIIGHNDTREITLKNMAKVRAEFVCKIDDEQFQIESTLSISASNNAPLMLNYEPTSLGSVHTNLYINSEEAGEYNFPLIGNCLPPKPQGPYTIIVDGTPISISFKNIFQDEKSFNLYVDLPAFTLENDDVTIESKEVTRIQVGLQTLEELSVTDTRFPVTGKLVISCSEPPLAHIKWTYYLKGVLD